MKLDFDVFKRNIKILKEPEISIIRNKYIDKFIDIQSEYYQKYIKKKVMHSDGLCYEGYLWDCLRNPTKIKMDDILSYSSKLDIIMVFWDIHSKDKILINNYWKFDKDAILQLNYKMLIDNLNYFPEDIYLFDIEYSFSLIITHEEEEGQRICAKVGII